MWGRFYGGILLNRKFILYAVRARILNCLNRFNYIYKRNWNERCPFCVRHGFAISGKVISCKQADPAVVYEIKRVKFDNLLTTGVY